MQSLMRGTAKRHGLLHIGAHLVAQEVLGRMGQGIGSDTVSTVPKATDEVAVSQTADASAGAGTTSQGTIPTDTVDPKAALPHGHARLAIVVLGRRLFVCLLVHGVPVVCGGRRLTKEGSYTT